MVPKSWLIFILILSIAAFLRLYQLPTVPPSLNWDEASIGWNAYSIWKVHIDEHGTHWPLIFPAFGDYKSPMIIYLTAPFVGLLGLTELAVRLPSALSGIAAVGVFYFLAGEVLSLYGFNDRFKERWQLVAMAMLAVSPWHLQFSRGAYEAVIALLFVLSGTWFFLMGLRKSYWWIASAFFFLLTFYTYNSAKLFIPLFVITVLVVFFRQIVQTLRKNMVASIIVGIGIMVGLIPFVQTNVFDNGAKRAEESIFFTPQGQLQPPSIHLLGTLVHNTYVHLSPSFYLLGQSDNLRISLKGFGLMPLVVWLLAVWGGGWMLKNKRGREWYLILAWYGLALIPAIICRDVPHSLRSLNALPAVLLLSTLGLASLFNNKHVVGNRLVLLAAVLLLSFSLDMSRYFHEYYQLYPTYAAKDWQYGYQEVAQLTKKYEDSVDSIIVSSKYGQPQTFISFYQQRDPMGVLWGSLIKYSFRDIRWQADSLTSNSLIVGTADEIPAIPQSGELVKDIKFPNGEVAFRIIRTAKL